MKLYHYTDALAIKSMLENGKLWLSDIRYLNDHSEYKDGENIIKSVFESESAKLPAADSAKILTNLDATLISSKSSYTFICSLSKGEDLLSQWRGYCPKTGGYALEFEINTHKDFGSPLHDCIYDNSAKALVAESLFKLVERVVIGGGNKSKLFQTVWSNIAKFKNPGFIEENESRVIIFKKQGDPDIKFRTSGSLFIPYLEIDLPYDKLKSVWVGPCQHPGLAQDSLDRFIDNLARNPNHALHTCQKPTVRLSSITFRG